MLKSLIGLAAGLIFGIGLTISQMIDPAKVLAFLDLLGDWNPSLAFVMAGALAVTALGYRLVLRRARPLAAETFHLPPRQGIDPRLLTGAALFGIGWGISGLCPGPAIAGVSLGGLNSLIFLGALVAGVLCHDLLRPTGAAPHKGLRATSV